ncbi:MAG TPA: DUF1003 domain-containing protein [Chitinophagales bacterium]|nr:DUF1003 domain-containing protein [Chitinophagales bacterium]
MSRRENLHQLIHSTENDIEKINDFFAENIDDDELLTQVLMQAQDKEATLGDKLSDKVAEFGGSWAFIITFFSILAGWILLNSIVLLQKPFDPYPFILLNLVLSCIAAIQAPIIMMSQNRKEDKDRQRAQSDYLINLKAEMEIKNLQLNMKNLFEIQKRQIELLDELKKEMVKSNSK